MAEFANLLIIPLNLLNKNLLKMPRRKDTHRILIIGSGPIVIGQACEFDFSGEIF
ncbi:MAG: hypothetical protein HC846_12870 [Blastocatellia bacterium]|nr:hypothetical protein [Blastocatellia bacterium]